MHFAYILKSTRFPDRIYKGQTEDLDKRLEYHNRGYVSHTRKYAPWRIVYFAGFETKERAIDFEKYLKAASGIAFMRKRLINK